MKKKNLPKEGYYWINIDDPWYKSDSPIIAYFTKNKNWFIMGEDTPLYYEVEVISEKILPPIKEKK